MDTTADYVHGYVWELLRTGLTLTDLLSNLLEALPDEAFPGEDTGEVLIEMLIGSVRPAIEAAGPSSVQEALALMGAVVERAIRDLRTAAELAARR